MKHRLKKIRAPAHGFTVIELLVILGTLSLILTATVSFLMSTLSSSGKAESIKEVRQNGDIVIKTLRSLLSSSSEVTGCTETIPDSIPEEISFISRGNSVTIGCVTDGSDSYVASNSARLTDQGVIVTDCQFYCLQPQGGSAYVYTKFKIAPAGQESLKDSEKVTQVFETSVSLVGI